MNTYTVALEDALGNLLVPALPFSTLDYARGANKVGVVTVTLPNMRFLGYFARDARLRVYHSVAEGHILEGRTFFFVRTVVVHEDSKQVTVTAREALSILERRIVAYPNQSLFADKTEDNGNSQPADDMIRAYVRENVASSAVDAPRRIANFLVEEDRGEAPVVSQAAGWANLLDTITAIADGVWESNQIRLIFSVEHAPQMGDVFTFRVATYSAAEMDAQEPTVFFAREAGNLLDVTVTYDYANECSVVYVGGDGQDEGRLIAVISSQARIDASPYNRIEQFRDERDAIDDSVLLAGGNATLKQNAPRVQIDATVADGVKVTYGVDYAVGDLVNVTVAGLRIKCLVDAVHVTVDATGSKLDIKLTGASPIP